MSIKPEWAKLRDDGWEFRYDTGTMILGIEHPEGGQRTIADFRSREADRLLCNQIGATLAFRLNDDTEKSELALVTRMAELEAAARAVLDAPTFGELDNAIEELEKALEDLNE